MSSNGQSLPLAAGLAALVGVAGAAFVFGSLPKFRPEPVDTASDSDESEEEEMPEEEASDKKRSSKMISGIARTNSLRRQVSGFSLADAKERNQRSAIAALDKTPRFVLNELQKGNTRFWMGISKRTQGTAFERRALIMSQFPQVAILGCSDSRVPVEIVFDQGLGEMFVVRVAGNCISNATSGSLEYAVHKLNVKVVMIMGHEGCGAIKASLRPLEEIEKEPANLASALKAIKAGLDVEHLANAKDHRAYDREAVVSNVYTGLDALTADPDIMKLVKNKELILLGCFYEISSGIVDFLKEVSFETLQ